MGSQFALARYDAYGNLDFSFHHDGKVLTGFDGEGEAGGTALVVDSRGRIVVAGFANRYAGGHFALARYTEDGNLDTSFGADGRVVTDFLASNREEANAVAIDAHDRIVVGGTAVVSGEDRFALARYLEDGSLDFTFSNYGKSITNFSSTTHEYITSLAIDRLGRIIVGGYADNRFALARYNENGSLDTSFDRDGKVLTDFTSASDPYAPVNLSALAIDQLGRIVVGGGADNRFALARYNEDGSLDTSFDRDGKVLTDFLTTETESIGALAIDRLGRIVVAGDAGGLLERRFALARYDEDGGLDTSFYNYGKVLTDFLSTTREGIRALTFDGQDRIIVGGWADEYFALARFTDVGTLDPSFHHDGKVITDFRSSDQESIAALATYPGARIVVAGSAWSPD